jgi:hypothetical protein
MLASSLESSTQYLEGVHVPNNETSQGFTVADLLVKVTSGSPCVIGGGAGTAIWTCGDASPCCFKSFDYCKPPHRQTAFPDLPADQLKALKEDLQAALRRVGARDPAIVSMNEKVASELAGKRGESDPSALSPAQLDEELAATKARLNAAIASLK